MESVTRLTPLGVMVLALLRERDMHPYEMIRTLRSRHEERLVTITNGTLYHTVNRLERAELIRPLGVEREGNRPERTTYRLTAAGNSATVEWVHRELGRTDRPDTFRIALAEAHNLPRAEVASLLASRRAALADETATYRSEVDEALCGGVNGQYLVEVERRIVLLEAELRWLDGLLVRLDDPSYAWGVHEPATPDPEPRDGITRKAPR